MKMPNFLRELMTSPAYMNKNSDEYATAEKYLRILYPGNAAIDATGRMTDAEYDMTMEQFKNAQAKLDDALQEAIKDTQEDIQEQTGRTIPDEVFDKYVILEEVIPVRVLMPSNRIEQKHLNVYGLNLPDDDDEYGPNKTDRIWRWHSEDGDNTCDECASRDGEIYESEDDIPEIPAHPNCRCTITEDEIDDNGDTVSTKPYKPKVPEIKSKQPDEQTKKDTFDKPVNTKPGQYLKFDGKTLTLYQDNKPIMSWDAVSGKPGFQSPEYQNKASTGPIPEGTYVARQEELQRMSLSDAVLGLSVIFNDNKIGGWPGSYYSWGNSRVWLEPSKNTNTYGRDGFSIHGGMWPGSAGCIDMTGQIGAFTSWFESTGKDILVYVKY